MEDFPVGNVLIGEQFHRLLQMEAVQEAGAGTKDVVVGHAQIHRATVFLRHGRRAPGVVEMAVGEQDGVGGEPVVAEEGKDPFLLVGPVEARIRDGTGFSGVLPENDAIGTQRIDLENLDLKHDDVRIRLQIYGIIP